MQVTMREKNKVWVGSPKLERVMGIEHGMIVLRSKDRRLLNRLVSTGLVKNHDGDSKTLYLYASPNLLNIGPEFITKLSADLGLDATHLMSTVHFTNFSTDSPTKLEALWTRLSESSTNTRLLVVDTIGYHRGRDAYLIDKVNKFCYYHNALALVLDSSEELDPTLERLATVVVDLDARGEGIEVFLRKHPRLPQTVFLMAA